MALRNLLVRVGADLSGLQKGMQKAQSQIASFGKNVNKSMALVGTALAAVGAAAALKPAIEDASKFEAMMGTLSESLGTSMDDFIKWQNTVGGSLGFSKLQSADLANTLSLNFKKIATSQEDLMNKTTKMMETAALISSKRGMAMSEVSDRIRSAMNQEADGADELGVNVRVSAIEQSKAYQMMANGTPWADLNQNMQKTILYHHVLQSVSENLGDSLQNNTSMKIAAFKASLGDVRLALGQAFLPILSVVLPVLTSFMRKIETALQYVSAFARALFGYAPSSKASTKATVQQTSAVSGLGDAIKDTSKEAKKAAKAAKANRGVAGFDQVNQLADPAKADGGSGSSGGGGGASGGGAGLAAPVEKETEKSSGALDKFTDKVKGFVKKFKKFFEPMKKPWAELKESLGMVWDSIKDLWNSKFVQDFVDWLSGGWDVGIAGVIKMVSGAFKILAGAIDLVTAILNGDFSKAWDGVKKILSGIWDMIVGVLEPLFPGFEKTVTEFAKNMSKMFTSIDWSDIASKVGKKVGEIWTAIKKPFINAYVWFRDSVVLKLSQAFNDKRTDAANKAIGIWNAIKGKFTGAYDWFKNNVVGKFGDVLTNWKGNIANKAGDIWNSIKGKFTGVYNWFKSNVVDKISSAFSKIKMNITDGLFSNVKSLINKLIGLINKPLKSIRNWSFMGKKPFGGLPTIPALAKGGITSGPMLAMIGDNPGGQEVVAPLDKLQSMLGTAVMSAMQFNQGGGSSGDIILNLDGRQFARIIKPHLDKENRRIGSNVRMQGI